MKNTLMTIVMAVATAAAYVAGYTEWAIAWLVREVPAYFRAVCSWSWRVWNNLYAR